MKKTLFIGTCLRFAKGLNVDTHDQGSAFGMNIGFNVFF